MAGVLCPQVCLLLRDQSWPLHLYYTVNGGDVQTAVALEAAVPYGVGLAHVNLTKYWKQRRRVDLVVWATDQGGLS